MTRHSQLTGQQRHSGKLFLKSGIVKLCAPAQIKNV